jgi:hypothetical protein
MSGAHAAAARRRPNTRRGPGAPAGPVGAGGVDVWHSFVSDCAAAAQSTSRRLLTFSPEVRFNPSCKACTTFVDEPFAVQRGSPTEVQPRPTSPATGRFGRSAATESGQLRPAAPQPTAQPGPNSTQTCPNSDAIRRIHSNSTVSQAPKLCMIAPSFNCKIEERLMAKRPTNNGASWSAGELRTLKQLAKAGTAQAAAKQLGRTPAAVQQKAMRTGISFRAAPAGRGRAAKKK